MCGSGGVQPEFDDADGAVGLERGAERVAAERIVRRGGGVVDGGLVRFRDERRRDVVARGGGVCALFGGERRATAVPSGTRSVSETPVLSPLPVPPDHAAATRPSAPRMRRAGPGSPRRGVDYPRLGV